VTERLCAGNIRRKFPRLQKQFQISFNRARGYSSLFNVSIGTNIRRNGQSGTLVGRLEGLTMPRIMILVKSQIDE
jgi:hypothetical protein